jgi:tetratricopeptide (TPR) repeat protein
MTDDHLPPSNDAPANLSDSQPEAPAQDSLSTIDGGGVPLLEGKRIAFVGRFAGMSRRDAATLARRHGAVVSEKIGPNTNLVILGEAELPLSDDGAPDAWLDEEYREAFEAGSFEIQTETQLWQRLKLVDDHRDIQRLYTPAMLADLLGVPVQEVRRWQRDGLIVPVRQVRKLPYFDFKEAATAQRLAELLAAGISRKELEQRLQSLARYMPNVERPLAQLSIIVEGKKILVRQSNGLVEPSGQRRFDFDAAEEETSSEEVGLSTEERGRSDPRTAEPKVLLSLFRGEDAPHPTPATIPLYPEGATIPSSDPRDETEDGVPATIEMPRPSQSVDAVLSPPDPRDPVGLRQWAAMLEDEGRLEEAAEAYRASLAAGGSDPNTCFSIAELLYRMGDPTAARERYYMAVEQDEHFVEARANLGCVLAELGQNELAVAAFEGALDLHEDYPDVHYHLARTFDQLDREGEAEYHYRRLLELSPNGSWSDFARQRLGGVEEIAEASETPESTETSEASGILKTPETLKPEESQDDTIPTPLDESADVPEVEVESDPEVEAEDNF